ncbi:discoidin domain-containing protein [Mycobacterium servetii]|uniref:Discoidin domain-containing protein n=1 Tax=Mycobacterium servetii TaxID=3237418 RepID=A0ABV4C9A4_9MYCO
MSATTDTTEDAQPQTNHGWDNRRTILAALAPRPSSRPARRAISPDEPAAGIDKPATPGVVSRCFRGSGRAARWVVDRVNKRIPPHHRVRTALITVAVLIALLAALGVVRRLATDNNTGSAVATPQHGPPPTSQPASAPVPAETILTGITASDQCPKDHGQQYSPIANAFDNDTNTAWICTRAKNSDGQHILVDFGREVTLTQCRIDPGFDARIPDTPDGVDQWTKHRIGMTFTIYYPKELNRKPDVINTYGKRGYSFIPGGIPNPPKLSKLLIIVTKTIDPPQSATDTAQTSDSSPANDVTTVAISEIQFLGFSS